MRHVIVLAGSRAHSTIRGLAVGLAATLALATPSLAQPKPPVKPPIQIIVPALRLDPVVVPAGIVTDQRFELPLRLRELQPGSAVVIESVTSLSTACRFVAASDRPLPSGVAGAGSDYGFSLAGAFFNSGSDATGPCSFRLNFRAANKAGVTAGRTLDVVGLRIAAPTVYVLTGTSDWKTRLGFSAIETQGTCAGNSTGPSGTHPVGMVTSSGDLAFQIRSGPLGTECVWRSKAILLPNGVKLTGIGIIQRTDRRCAVGLQRGSAVSSQGRTVTLPATMVDVSVRSVTNPAVGMLGVTAGVNPNGAGLPITVVGSLEILLQCGTTAINDNIAFLAIDSLTFIGPAGLSFP